MFSKALFVLAAFALGVNAQYNGISSCILGCVQPAATQNGCSGPYAFPTLLKYLALIFFSRGDLPCVCNNQQFQASANACLQQSCSASDIQSASLLQQQNCGTSNARR